jgi:hypothetical protein
MQSQRLLTADRYDFKLRRVAADRNAIVRDRRAAVNSLLAALNATLGDIKNNQFMVISMSMGTASEPTGFEHEFLLWSQ